MKADGRGPKGQAPGIDHLVGEQCDVTEQPAIEGMIAD